jgi:hypothetical protein
MGGLPYEFHPSSFPRRFVFVTDEPPSEVGAVVDVFENVHAKRVAAATTLTAPRKIRVEAFCLIPTWCRNDPIL